MIYRRNDILSHNFMGFLNSKRVKKLIKEIWILEKHAGRCVFNGAQTKAGKLVDPDLISTVLNVLYHISIELSGKGIETVVMAGFRWFFVTEGELIFISMADMDTSLKVLKEKTIIIKNEFFLKNAEISKTNDFFKLWDGKVSDFDVFNRNLKSLFSDWSKAEVVTDHATSLDLLEVYQQLFKLHQVPDIAPKNAQSRKYLKKTLTEAIDKHPYLKDKVTFEENKIEILEKFDKYKSDLECIDLQDMLYDLCKSYIHALKRINGPDIFFQFMRKNVIDYFGKDWERIEKLKLLRSFFEIFFVDP